MIETITTSIFYLNLKKTMKMTWLHMQFVLIFITADSRALRKLFIFIFRSRSRSPGKPTSNISSIVKPAILREEPIPGSEQGNSLKGTDKKTGKREGKESIKRVFSQFLFSVTHSLQGKKMFGNCSLFDREKFLVIHRIRNCLSL